MPSQRVHQSRNSRHGAWSEVSDHPQCGNGKALQARCHASSGVQRRTCLIVIISSHCARLSESAFELEVFSHVACDVGLFVLIVRVQPVSDTSGLQGSSAKVFRHGLAHNHRDVFVLVTASAIVLQLWSVVSGCGVHCPFIQRSGSRVPFCLKHVAGASAANLWHSETTSLCSTSVDDDWPNSSFNSGGKRQLLREEAGTLQRALQLPARVSCEGG